MRRPEGGDIIIGVMLIDPPVDDMSIREEPIEEARC